MDAAVGITGIGAVTPLGADVAGIARRLLAGESAIGVIERFDTSQFPWRIAGNMVDVPCPAGTSPAEFAKLDRFVQVLHWTLSESLRDANLWSEREQLRIGVAGGLGGEWLAMWEDDAAAGGDMIYRADAAPLSRLEQVCANLKLRGPVVATGSACASSNFAMAQGRQWLRQGWVDVALVGGVDLGVSPIAVSSFGNLGALSKRNDAPTAASRPFDKNRDGFVLGEGGIFFVLERIADAQRRGARIWAEVAGFGAASDAAHLVIPSSDPTYAARAMRAALADARLEPAQIDYINAHATSTPIGDTFETQGLKAVFGDAIRTLPVSATKSMSGHLLSAAAAFESLVCLVAMDQSAIPPTINLDEPDPECDLCHVAHQTQSRPVRIALNNSFGFGGSNTCIVLRKSA